MRRTWTVCGAAAVAAAAMVTMGSLGAVAAWAAPTSAGSGGRTPMESLSSAGTSANPQSGPAGSRPAIYKGHDLPRLRGAMIGPRVDEADLREFGGKWKANHVRWQLIWGGFPRSPADKASPAEYDAWLETEFSRLDRLLPVCREAGILAVIDVHTPPGGRDDQNACRLFQDKRWQDQFVAVWERIARRYKGNSAVWGYDLVNEPVWGKGVAEGLLSWRDLAILTSQRIRAIDGQRAIIFEPGPWGAPQALTGLEPLPITNVIYSVHMYQPHQFTHQGVYGGAADLTYPGKIAGKSWDKNALREALRPAVEFQRKHNVHIYIGEFSAIRWAPGDSARDYLRDVIEIMEENGWDWAYHAFREWSGWSVEHGSDRNDPKPAAAPTDRQKLLLEWFARNRRPG